MLTKRDKGNEPTEKVQPPSLRENPQVNADIDQHIKDNPAHWAYIKELPPERMAA